MKSSKHPLILIFGPNGAGKGTLAQRLAKDFGFYHFSMGNFIREWIEEYDQQDLKELIDNGDLLPDEIVKKVLDWKFNDFRVASGVLMDGFPRKKSQVFFLPELCEKLGWDIKGVIVLNAPLDLVLQRVTRRVLAPDGVVYHLDYNPPPSDIDPKDLLQRDDDRPDIVVKRYEEYSTNILDSLSHPYFSDVKIYNIDSSKTIEEVYREAEGILKDLI